MPYRSQPGRPGQRLVPGRGLLDNPIMRVEDRKPKTPQSYGREAEKKAVDELKRAGWTVTRSHLSRGAADLVATKLENGALATTIIVQVKATQTYRPTFLNKGVLEVLTAPPVHSREAWGYVWGKGHVVTVSFAPDGSFIVTGKEPYRAGVEQAVRALCNRNLHAAKRGKTVR